MNAPKLFISYSWSDVEHEQWVISFATELRESGVDVILDKWDLKEGHDAVAFMEKMVTDPQIKKVAIICDEQYAAKADGRAGGVGTETQIISKKVYENQIQEKFVAVVRKKDEAGKPYLPTYYSSRIYIDLCEDDQYTENFERLLRWVFDKPLYIKPEIGQQPAFLAEGVHVSLGTTAVFKRCVDAIKSHKAYSDGAFDEYCNMFVANLERFRISSYEGHYDDEFIKNIEEFLPFRNEAIQLFIVIAQHSQNDEFVIRLHRFFENLIPYMFRPQHISQYVEWDFDNFKFIVHELYLYALAVLLKYEKFNQINFLLGQQYYMLGNSDYGKDVMVSFTVFRQYLKSLESRNKRLKLRRHSLHSDILNQRCVGTAIDFRFLMQADFVAFIREEIDATGQSHGWWPETLLYLPHSHSPFEIFARSISKSYFDRAKIVLGIDTPKDIEPLLAGYKDRSLRLPSWDNQSFSPAVLIGHEQLATKP